jgi:signal transduction histidine kinase
LTIGLTPCPFVSRQSAFVTGCLPSFLLLAVLGAPLWAQTKAKNVLVLSGGRGRVSINALSHRLHSSKLEYLGLVAALRGFCREFSDQHRVTVNFSHDAVPDDLPPEIALCLFRVAQAALLNALKHSRVTSFDVHVGASAARIHLRVHDAGVGFDVDKTLGGHGLGLISMRERVRAANGDISIRSRPAGGTTIEASVPLHRETPALTIAD